MVEFKRRKRREIVQPQLVAMIDICSLITVFLLAGSVFGPDGLVVPPGLGLARSVASADPAVAPQIMITELGVEAPFLKENYNHEIFKSNERQSGQVSVLKRRIGEYLKSEAAQAATEGVTLNVVADRRVRYDQLFDIITLFREGGFEGVAFIAMSEGK